MSAAPSRLPAPTPKSRLPAPPSSSVGVSKRPRPSVDLEEGQAKKVKRPITTGASNLSKAKSMLQLNAPSAGTATRFTQGSNPAPGGKSSFRAPSGPPGRLPNSHMTGRPSNLTARSSNLASKRVGAATTRHASSAMKDRTNLTTGGKTATAGSAAGEEGAKAGGGKARPKWDLKGRLEDMEALFSSTNARVASLEAQKVELETDVQQKEVVVTQNSEELKQVAEDKKRVEERLEMTRAELTATKRQLDDLAYDKSALERKCRGLEDELESRQAEVSGLKTTVAQLTSASAGLEAECQANKRMLASSQDENSRLNKLSSEQASRIDIFEENERAFETERRKLHNIIQELKGNIRVFCRVRPLLGDEVSKYDGRIPHIALPPQLGAGADKKSLSLVRTADSPPGDCSVAGGLKGKSGRYDFEFDRVFHPESSQTDVFEEISQLVQSAIDGYNVCVFAYGQTGSGKTFTMEGGENEGQEGMIPLTIRKIFQETNRLTEKGWTYTLESSFLEIYNEEIRDLLATEKNLKYDVKMSSEDKNAVYVTNVKTEKVETAGQIAALLKRARKARAVAATNCNERSSRSHSVFQLKISGSNSLTTESCTGTLNLVDLAGSERLKDSGSEGLRLTETKNINKSLANLGNVIMALAQKDSHVPYRNSKLTHLLQGSLGGNSKTLMFVNVSPREEYFGETLNSLRFATKVNQCQIGTATKKVK